MIQLCVPDDTGQVSLPLYVQRLSHDHPLRKDPSKPWPYVVTVGYRAAGREIVYRRRVHVRSTGIKQAEADAIRYCREIACPVRDDSGRLLKASRPMSSRPMDKSDAIGA